MNQSFRSGVSLHHLITDAPMDSLEALLKPQLPSWTTPLLPDEDGTRAELLSRLNQLPAEKSRQLEDIAVRIQGLATGRGAESLQNAATSRFAPAELADFRAQPDELGRSIWTFLNHLRLFEDAESLQYALHFRNFGRIYAAFDVPVVSAFTWSPDTERRLSEHIRESLGIEDSVHLSHLIIDEEGEKMLSHVVIMRHGGLHTSVAEHRPNGGKGRHYYQPPNEVTLIYAPSRGVVEVCADSPSLRQDVAASFAEAGLGQDLSKKPLSFKLYNLSRFRQSLTLPFFEPEGWRLERSSVVEVEIRSLPTQRLSLKVAASDEIEMVANRLLGSVDVLRGAPISRLVIAVQYWPRNGRRTRTLNIALSHPNRCNLRSQADPELRKLGYDLLEHWKVLQALRPLARQDERTLLPLLLAIYDQGEKVLSEQDLQERGLDVAALAGHGFIEPAGRYECMVLDEDDGGSDLVELRPGMAGNVEFDDTSGRPAWHPAPLFTKYSVDLGWVEEVVLRQLGEVLVTRKIERPVVGLTFLGQVALGGENVPCYLGRALRQVRTLRRVDDYLRSRGEDGVGLILNAGAEAPDCLGTNVVVALQDFLNEDSAAPTFDLDGLCLAFRRGKARALGGMSVEFVKSDQEVGVLHVPGKPTLLVAGRDQVTIVERLVDAHRDRTLVVRTAALMDGTGSQSPSQAFPNWKRTVDRYIGSPKRGFWQLLV